VSKVLQIRLGAVPVAAEHGTMPAE